MTVTKVQREKIALYVRNYIIRTAERHGHQNALFRANARWMHTLNVGHNLELILKGEKASEYSADVCRVAALFHDVDHYTVQQEYHAARGAETATRFLTKEGYDAEFIKLVATAIREHDRDLNDEIPVEDQVRKIVETLSLECRMLIDADTLDKIGANNILQAVTSLANTEKRQVSDIARELNSGWPLQRARLWKDMLSTPTGIAMGDQRFGFYQRFLQQIETEIVMVDPYPELKQTQQLSPLTLPHH